MLDTLYAWFALAVYACRESEYVRVSAVVVLAYIAMFVTIYLARKFSK